MSPGVAGQHTWLSAPGKPQLRRCALALSPFPSPYLGLGTLFSPFYLSTAKQHG